MAESGFSFIEKAKLNQTNSSMEHLLAFHYNCCTKCLMSGMIVVLTDVFLVQKSPVPSGNSGSCQKLQTHCNKDKHYNDGNLSSMMKLMTDECNYFKAPIRKLASNVSHVFLFKITSQKVGIRMFDMKCKFVPASTYLLMSCSVRSLWMEATQIRL